MPAITTAAVTNSMTSDGSHSDQESYSYNGSGINHMGNTDSFACFAYRAMPLLRVEKAGLPSIRYLRLLVEGGRAAGLSTSYLEKLEATPCLSFEGITVPDDLLALLTNGSCASVTLADVRRHDYTSRHQEEQDRRSREASDGVGVGGGSSSTATTPAIPTTPDVTASWITVAGWVFDVSTVIAHRAMLRQMSGRDGTFYCLSLWATAYGAGCEVELDTDGVVPVSTLSLRQQQYLWAWLHHFNRYYPVVGVLCEQPASCEMSE